MEAIKKTCQAVFDFIVGNSYGHLNIKCSSMIEPMLQKINGFSSDIWSHPLIENIIDFVASVGIVVFIYSIPFLLSDIGSQVDNLDWKTIFTTFVKSVIYVFTIKYFGVLVFSIGNLFIERTNFKIEPSGIMEFVERSELSLIMSIIINIIAFVFLVMAYYRLACMLVHIISSVLYIPFIVRGDTQKIGEWFQIAVSLSVTYIIQFIAMYIALEQFFSNNFTMGILFVFVAFVCGYALKNFGYQTGAKNAMSNLGRTAMATARAAKLLF